MLQKINSFIQAFKKLSFQFLFVLQHNAISNKHLQVFVQFLQLISLIYFYFNPLYYQLHNFTIFQHFFKSIWPQLFIITTSSSFLLSLILLLILPSIIICIAIMKFIFGYQYLLIVAIQIFILFYPALFIKFTIQSINIMIGFPDYRVFGIFISIFHTIGSVLVLHMYDKKYKLLDILPIILIYFNVSSYAVLSIVVIRMILSYILSPNTLIKPLRFYFQISLLLILILSYFASDYLTNYVSFILIFVSFTLSQIVSIVRNYNEDQTIFYHLQNLNQQQSDSKLKYYDFIQNHRIQCQHVHCMCRQLSNYTKDEQIKQKGYKFVEKLYSFKEDFDSRIQLGLVSCQYYEYSLSSLLLLLKLKPQSLYQEYKLYYVKTKYQQEFRRLDKNYSFGQEYYNAYQQLRSFQQKIEQLTKIIKLFWQTILNFDGTKKFLSMIIDISQKIIQIKNKYQIYIQKYQDFGNQFRYLYKTFQIAVLNLLDKDKLQNNYSFGTTRKQINIKVPERQLFMISNAETKVTNCNRQFCNLVEMQKQDILNQSYSVFIPQTCSQQHNQWVKDWYQNYNRDDQQKKTLKPFLLKNDYVKCVKIQNRVLPRFNTGVQVISLIKVIMRLQTSSHHKGITSQIGQQLISQQQNLLETFFSFYIEKSTMKILNIDDSFFYTTFIDQSDDIKNKILSLKINEMFPKVVISGKVELNLSNQSMKEAMLNYSALEEFLGSKEKNAAFNNSNNNTIANNNKSRTVSMISKTQRKSSLQSDDDQPLPFSRKSRRKMTNASGLSTVSNNNTHHGKDNTQQIFSYQIIDQQNVGLDTEYCIVNFQLKKNVAGENQNVRTKQKTKTKIILNQSKDQKKQRGSKMPEEDGQKEILNIIQKGKQKQSNAASLTLNLAFRQPFIRSSKPYKQQKNQEQQIDKKKAKIQQTNQFTNASKSYCLAWPIIFPLFIVHAIYMYIQQKYQSLILYLSYTFDYYDKYQLQTLRQLTIYMNNQNYVDDLKELWIKGYGFYHSSILGFQNGQDPYYSQKLMTQVIPINLYGIYQEIQKQFTAKIQDVNFYYVLIIITLLVFILYALVDFAFNVMYCFKISSKVTEIISIFLNISQKDIKKLIYSINKYQDEVLEMVDFNQLERQKKRDQQDYKLEEYQGEAGLIQMSGIGLLKEDKYSFFGQLNLKNMESIDNSPIKDDGGQSGQNPNNFINGAKSSLSPATIIPKNSTKKRNSSKLGYHKRRSSCAQRIDISKLKQSMAFLKQSTDSQRFQDSKKQLLLQSNFNTKVKKSSFVNDTSMVSQFKKSNISQDNPIIQLRDEIIVSQEDVNTQQQQKLQKISKFKQQYRGNINDIKQNPKPYLFLLIVILLTVGILIAAIIVIPKYLNNLQKFYNVYANIRKLKIIMLNDFIKKQTNIQLRPQVKASVYSLDLYITIQDKLIELPNFIHFWDKVYSDDVCLIVQDPVIIELCSKLDNLMTKYGQKVMFQYIEDYLRRKKPAQLFGNSSTNPSKFMNVSKLQMNLIELGQSNLKSEIHSYKSQAQKHELLLAVIGTIFLLISILMSHKGLSYIRSKINDGQNLLLIVPENIKTNVIKNMNQNKLKQQIDSQEKEKSKKNKKRRSLSRSRRNSPLSPSSPASTGSQLVANRSSFLNSDQDSILKSSLKAPQKKVSFTQSKSRASNFKE